MLLRPTGRALCSLEQSQETAAVLATKLSLLCSKPGVLRSALILGYTVKGKQPLLERSSELCLGQGNK